MTAARPQIRTEQHGRGLPRSPLDKRGVFNPSQLIHDTLPHPPHSLARKRLLTRMGPGLWI
jgi:hypothetical protein